jgi:hypothetical protein
MFRGPPAEARDPLNHANPPKGLKRGLLCEAHACVRGS